MNAVSMSYDPEARRETPLALALKARIVRHGPIPVADYMAACLGDETHGYYRTRQAIGTHGDFVTAPEISQVFGELIGLWTAVVWQQMGAPSRFQLVEVGPGRGTMLADALRAARRVPGFVEAADVVLVEPSPVLAETQRATLRRSGAAVRWGPDLSDVPPGPTIFLANEVLDVLPVVQLARQEGIWRERVVRLGPSGRLDFGLAETPWSGALPGFADRAKEGDILELRDLAPVTGAAARIASGGPFAGLFIDYGHEASGLGETLQAVRRHRAEHPLTSPGEADLTTQVDFAAASAAFRAAGLSVEQLVTQGEWLGALGIAERASRLMAANPARAGEIELGIARLMAPQGMGTRFKALGVRSPGLAALPGFPSR
jgi:NADH dehydrogenase [ubiquinone] 1 alpha subcomplex assembly factor 7